MTSPHPTNAPVLTSAASERLRGTIQIPGDKSISHRALIFGALADGQTTVEGLLESEDVMATRAALACLGAEIEADGPGRWQIRGVGLGRLNQPDTEIDMGNTGTGVRLLMGLVATHPLKTGFTGDASLCARPMERVMAPLRGFGASFDAQEGGRLPIKVHGAAAPRPISYTLPVASAQVKSAVLLAGLNTSGTTEVIEPIQTRDHSETMLAQFGAQISSESVGAGNRIRLAGPAQLQGQNVQVPGDPSSAAFPVVAGLLVPGSQLTIPRVGMNRLRAGLFEVLKSMGADLETVSADLPRGGEPMADLTVRASGLQGIDVPSEIAPRMIDEYPILAVAAACAAGTTIMRGVGELRVKESDRIAAMEAGLKSNGVQCESDQDTLIVHGCDGAPPGGGHVDSGLDHRIAMSFAVLGLVSQKPIRISGADTIATSFPGFVGLINGLGGNLQFEPP
ncbi:MAG: 3-phosphoshikimate 1-carboxyvinyltransferase [Pseudomonadota bacterium]